MRWPLRYQILVPFAGVMLAVVLLISLLDAVLAARRTERQIQRQLHDVAQTLLEANFPLTDAVLRQTRGLSGAEFVLTDGHQQMLASSMSDFDLAAIPSVAPSEGDAWGELVQWSAQQYFHTVVAVRPRGTQTEEMQLHILYPQHVLREARWQAAYPPLVVGTILLGVVVVLAVVIAGRLSRPILELRRQLSRLVEGRFEPIPLPRRHDELRDLIISVNALGDQLDDLRRVIKRSERLALFGQLSGGLAHQLRNSVTGAKLAVQLHQRHCRQIDQDSLNVALRQLAMTEAHLQRFLTAGQGSAPRRGTCELRQLVADVVALVAPACDHRGVTLDAAQAVANVEFSADADQLRQLLLNLLLNAIEAAGPGGWVRIIGHQDQGQLALRVEDSGPGPDARMLERLFEPFATGKPEGIGLGLAVARQFVAAHGGTIRYTREPTTCFEVVLPLDNTVNDAPLEIAPRENGTLRAVSLEQGGART